MGITNRPVLDRQKALELVLELNDFSGGLNTISEDHATNANEARRLENWESNSRGGMIRAEGINEVANNDSGATYTDQPDLLVQHEDTGGTKVFCIVEGNLLAKSGANIELDHVSDASSFTSGTLSTAVSAGEALWITNATDNLKRKTIGNAVAAVTTLPAQAYDRVSNHKNRLILEGGASTLNRIAGSRVGTGNWNSADTWTASNDAWSIDITPERETKGHITQFPSGNDITVFGENSCYIVSNQPNVTFRKVLNGRGCSAPLSIARGDEGVYFVSRRPTLGVFLYDGVNFIDLTEFQKDMIPEKINFTGRVYGIYRDRKYHLFFNDAAGNQPNCWWIFDARFKRWMKRDINSGLADEMGYPALLPFSSNELYAGSDRDPKLYELETGTDDEGNDTKAVYETKAFSSKDFSVASGGAFPIDDVRLKLTKVELVAEGTTGNITFLWDADKGIKTGSKTFTLQSAGDLINDTFTVNTSSVVATPPDFITKQSMQNGAIGRRFSFQINHSGQSTRAQIKRIKIHAVAYDEL